MGCRTLFGLPAGALWNTSVEGADIAGAAGGELWERLQGLAGWPERFGVCDEVLFRRFGHEFGLGPKLAGRVIRFERARHMLSAPSFVTIAQVAASCGYYDQAHLNRDFAELAGCSPTAWMAEELPSFRDDAMAGV